VWFFIALALYWTPPFLVGLSPRMFSGIFDLFIWAPFLFYFFSYVFLLQVFLSVFPKRYRDMESGCSRRGLAFRLVCFLAALTAMVTVHLVGVPLTLGRLCGAKWGMDLPALKRLQSSPEVAALAETGGSLAIVPPYLNSSYWGPPRSVIVEPKSTGSPVIMLNWGGGFYSYGIVVSHDAEFPLPSDTYLGTPWTDGVWVFVAP
jgi:hypothetical protein